MNNIQWERYDSNTEVYYYKQYKFEQKKLPNCTRYRIYKDGELEYSNNKWPEFNKIMGAILSNAPLT